MKYFIEIPGLVKDNGGKCWLIKVLLKNPQCISNNSSGIIVRPTAPVISPPEIRSLKDFQINSCWVRLAGMWTFMIRQCKVVD